MADDQALQGQPSHLAKTGVGGHPNSYPINPTASQVGYAHGFLPMFPEHAI